MRRTPDGVGGRVHGSIVPVLVVLAIGLALASSSAAEPQDAAAAAWTERFDAAVAADDAGKTARAHKLLAKALEFVESFPPGDERHLRTVRRLAAIERRQRNPAGARAAYTTAIEGIVARVGPDDPAPVRFLVEAALYERDDLDFSERSFVEARRLGRLSIDPEAGGLVDTLYALANFCDAQDDAILRARAVRAREEIDGLFDTYAISGDPAPARATLARYYVRKGRLEDAARLYEGVLAQLRPSLAREAKRERVEREYVEVLRRLGREVDPSALPVESRATMSAAGAAEAVLGRLGSGFVPCGGLFDAVPDGYHPLCAAFDGPADAFKRAFAEAARGTRVASLAEPHGRWRGEGGVWCRRYASAGGDFEARFSEDRGCVAVIAPKSGAAAPPPLPEPPDVPEFFEGEPVYVSESGLTRPRRVSYVDPEMPDKAREARVEGSVFLTCIIRSDGSVAVLEVRAEPEGYGLAEAAREAVGAWRYRPATLHGVPVTSSMTVHVHFSHH